jgi:hypothetical protein
LERSSEEQGRDEVLGFHGGDWTGSRGTEAGDGGEEFRGGGTGTGRAEKIMGEDVAQATAGTVHGHADGTWTGSAGALGFFQEIGFKRCPSLAVDLGAQLSERGDEQLIHPGEAHVAIRGVLM